MSKVQKLFRYVWRVNALLIFFAAAGVCLAIATLMWSEFGGSAARSRVFEAAPVLGAPNSSERLILGQVEAVDGTTLRGELVAPRSGVGLSSGSGYSETRNILFVDTQAGPGRWLLADDDHVIATHPDVTTRDPDGHNSRRAATVALVKPAGADLEAADGTLLLFDPAGRHVQTVADGVRELHSATVDAQGRITLLFERQRRYVLASFDTVTLEMKQEREVTLPALK